jgi:Neuraminidase (sialidase)
MSYRRTFLLVALLALVPAAIHAESPRKLSEAERVIAVRGQGYFPVMIKLRDGTLGAVVRGGASHLGKEGRLDYLRSTDGGRTWSAPIVAVDGPWDDRNPALGEMPDGTLVIAYAEARCYEADGTFRWKPDTYSALFVTSKDGGRTWSPRQPFRGPWSDVSPYGKITVLKDGTALMSIYQYPSQATGILRSKDNGATWGDYTGVPGHDETQVLALPDGRLMAFSRMDGDREHGLLLSESDDQGRTWVRTRQLLRAMQWPFDATVLQSGQVLLSYGSREGLMGAGVMLSRDQGKTWDEEHRVLIGWDSLGVDTGYPSTVQLDDGTIVTMYYAVGTAASPDTQAIVVRYTEAMLAKSMTQ